jgi:hypothetical protein
MTTKDDWAGYPVRPALVNYHDHLELNHYPRTRPRDRYANAHDWADDVNACLDAPPYRQLRAYTFFEKAFIGALKNLLCGVTTVFQHGEPKRALFSQAFPVRVVRRYGWAHSLHLTPAPALQRAYRATPRGARFFVHLAEGTDERARAEYARLKALGCVGAQTVLVHGVGMSADDIDDARARGCWLVACPTTNAYLLGAVADVPRWRGQVVLGSDSRLTADGDLLAEIATAQGAGWQTTPAPFADVNALTKRDFIIAEALTARTDVQLVVRDGVALFGTPALMARARVPVVACTLDGQERAIHARLAECYRRVKLKEVGFVLDDSPRKRWRFRLWQRS